MNNMPNINSAQQWLSDPDISQARILKHWLEEELNISIHQVESINIHADVVEMSPQGEYRLFKPGQFSHFVLTLLDGSKLHRSFRKA